MQTTRGSWRAVRPGDGRPAGHPGTGRATPWGRAASAVTVSDRLAVHGLARLRAWSRTRAVDVDVDVDKHDPSSRKGMRPDDSTR